MIRLLLPDLMILYEDLNCTAGQQLCYSEKNAIYLNK